MAEGKTVGSLVVELVATDKEFKRGMNRAETVISKFRTAAMTAFNKLKSFLLSWKTAIVALIGAAFSVKKIKDFASGIIEATSSYEQLRLSLKVLLKDQEKSNAAFKEGIEISKKTPFDITEVLEQYKLLLAYQFEQREIPKILMLASDAATAYGKSLDEVVRGVAYLKAGRLEESLAGLGVTREALKGEGIKFDAGGSLKSSADELMAAVFKMWSDTVGGISAEGTKTWKGMVSNLKNEWVDFEARIGDAGFFDAIKDSLATILNQIARWAADETLQKWAEGISSKMEGVLYGAEKIVSFLTGIEFGKEKSVFEYDTKAIDETAVKLDDLYFKRQKMKEMMEAQTEGEGLIWMKEAYDGINAEIDKTISKRDDLFMGTEVSVTPPWAQTIIDAVESIKETFTGNGSFVENLVDAIASAFQNIDLGSILYGGVDWAAFGVNIMADIIAGFKNEVGKHGGFIGILKGYETVGVEGTTYYGNIMNSQGVVVQAGNY